MEEEKVIERLGKLSNFGGECNCSRKKGTIQTIHIGNMFDEILIYCKQCGGICDGR